MDSLPARLAHATPISLKGTWQRHVPAKYVANALAGRSATGRWGTEGGFPVLYLGQPTNSIVVEAYRHLIDPIADNPVPPISPRALITCDVSVSMILDLRSAANRVSANLTMEQLQSEHTGPCGLLGLSERSGYCPPTRVPRFDRSGRDSDG